MYRVEFVSVCEIIFFFKQKTAYELKECDWSSDVCSSDLIFCLLGVLLRFQYPRLYALLWYLYNGRI